MSDGEVCLYIIFISASVADRDPAWLCVHSKNTTLGNIFNTNKHVVREGICLGVLARLVPMKAHSSVTRFLLKLLFCQW